MTTASGLSLAETTTIPLYLHAPRYHAMTCPCRDDGQHKRREGMDLGQLVCDFGGMYCPDCDYRQDYPEPIKDVSIH